MEEYLGEMDEEYLGQVEGESLARDMLDHAYHHRCCKLKSRDDLVSSMSWKMSSNDVSYPIRCPRGISVYNKEYMFRQSTDNSHGRLGGYLWLVRSYMDNS